jgi:hypothetical protein
VSEAALLAARLRQSVQGCALHLHGPVQAWQAIEEAARAGKLSAVEVASLAVEAGRLRLVALASEAVPGDDPRVRKERLAIRFIAALFGLIRPNDDANNEANDRANDRANDEANLETKSSR